MVLKLVKVTPNAVISVLSALVKLKVLTFASVVDNAVVKPDTELLKFPTVIFVASNAA